MKLLEGINVNVILQQIIVELINFTSLLALKMSSEENIVMRENLAVLPQLEGDIYEVIHLHPLEQETQRRIQKVDLIGKRYNQTQT